MGLTYTRPYTAVAAVPWYGDLSQGQLDASGKMYMRNRYYDPGTGRFTQEDPVGLAGGMNLYGFAGGDPVNFSDPFGLCPDPRGVDFCPGSQGLKSAISPLDFIGPGELKLGKAAFTLLLNRAAGKLAEKLVERALVKEGYRVLASQIKVKPSAGTRVIDHLVQSAEGEIMAVEVKSGNATRNASQLAADGALEKEGGRVLRENLPPGVPRDLGPVRTIERRP
jgi:RHS repeat-associated protein